ncbi:SRPBCC domain-containing protein [Geodermatophilus sp. URMC 61]|uniref:SRPBCC domain-containing protein n=1 Tax=Geodermatophilus sp. URMC 61 TaxID=3423411 RepID=UPI00406CE6D8
MRSFEASARIDASPEDVWALLVDVGSWRDWDSGVDRVDGRVALGEKLTLYATMIRNRPFTVTVTEIRPREAMRWRAGLPLGLAVIERTYRLDAQEDGGTALTVREDHTGPLAALLARSTPDLNPSFRQFCQGLKARAEGRTSRPTG